MQGDQNILAEALAEIASAGALAVAPYLRRAARSVPAIETKRDAHDPVTEHDRAVEQMLREYFADAIPGSRILGEELGEEVLSPTGGGASEAHEVAGGLAGRVRWIADPIDGTANFAAGSTFFGTSVAAELDGEVVAGAISIPYTGELFWADLRSAWHSDREGNRTRLHSEGPLNEETALLVSYYPNRSALADHPQMSLDHLTDLTESYMAVRRTGAAALDLAMVAAGWEGAMLGMSFGPWDVAAGIHLVNVAGGNVVNLSTSDSLPDGLRPAVLASTAGLNAKTGERVLREYVAAYRLGLEAGVEQD